LVVRSTDGLASLGCAELLGLGRKQDSANGNAIASNDNWQQSTQAAQIQSSGFAPPNGLEPAIINTRPLGNTTAIVSGKNGTTGVALVEVYRLP
jgi:hypothetical protein